MQGRDWLRPLYSDGGRWPESTIALLRTEWTNGLSASQIAIKIGAELGEKRTRNAVIGKVHRLGLAGRASPSHPPKRRVARGSRRLFNPFDIRVAERARKRIAVREPVPVVPIPDPLNVPLLELTFGQCKAVTDPTRYAQRCCGNPTNERGVYCAGHEAFHSAPAKGRGA